MTPTTVTRWNGSYPGETRAAITSNAIRATAGPRLVMAQSIETGHHGAGGPAVCSPAGAEDPGNLVQGLAHLGQALRRETGSRERVAADPVDHGFQEVFPRYGQAPCVQLGQVDLADLVPGLASGQGSRGLECLFAGARAAPGLRSHLAEVGEFDAVFVEAAPFLLGARHAWGRTVIRFPERATGQDEWHEHGHSPAPNSRRRRRGLTPPPTAA